MDRLTGTRYAYPKTRVAYLVPFIFLVPAAAVVLIIIVLSSPTLYSGEFLADVPNGVKIAAVVLFLLLLFVARDLWLTFQRVISEEIWITDRDIVWIGRGKRVLVKATHLEIQKLVPLGRSFDNSWIYKIETAHGTIRFTRAIEHADELIERVQRFLERAKPI